jgi:hypothetical protein
LQWFTIEKGNVINKELNFHRLQLTFFYLKRFAAVLPEPTARHGDVKKVRGKAAYSCDDDNWPK